MAREEFEVFCGKVTASMPLKIVTLWTPTMFDRAYELSEGYPGRVADLVQDAAMFAVESGAEHITEDILQSMALAVRLQGRDVSQKRAGRRGKE